MSKPRQENGFMNELLLSDDEAAYFLYSLL